MQAALYYDFFKAAVDNFEAIMTDDEDRDATLKFINEAITFLKSHAQSSGQDVSIFQPLTQLAEFTLPMAQNLLTAARKVCKQERQKSRKQMDSMKKLADLNSKVQKSLAQEKPGWTLDKSLTARTRVKQTRALLGHMRECLPEDSEDLGQLLDQIQQSEQQQAVVEKKIDENDVLLCLLKQSEDLRRQTEELDAHFRALKAQAAQTTDPAKILDIMKQLQECLTKSDELREQSAQSRAQVKKMRDEIEAL
jgi:hypothetical protein